MRFPGSARRDDGELVERRAFEQMGAVQSVPRIAGTGPSDQELALLAAILFTTSRLGEASRH